MISLREAIKIAEKNAPEGYTLRDSYAEAQGKYLFEIQNAQGMIPPGGFLWAVDKETGECKWECPEREFLAPYAPIKGYKRLYLEEQ